MAHRFRLGVVTTLAVLVGLTADITLCFAGPAKPVAGGAKAAALRPHEATCDPARQKLTERVASRKQFYEPDVQRFVRRLNSRTYTSASELNADIRKEVCRRRAIDNANALDRLRNQSRADLPCTRGFEWEARRASAVAAMNECGRLERVDPSRAIRKAPASERPFKCFKPVSAKVLRTLDPTCNAVQFRDHLEDRQMRLIVSPHTVALVDLTAPFEHAWTSVSRYSRHSDSTTVIATTSSAMFGIDNALWREFADWSRIGLSIISHLHRDHFASAAPGLNNVFDVAGIARWFMRWQAEQPLEAARWRLHARADPALALSELAYLPGANRRIMVGQPHATECRTANDRSLIVRVEAGRCATVYPSDATWRTLPAVAQSSVGSTDLLAPAFTLNLPHHSALPKRGPEENALADWLHQIRPALVMIYGKHPKQSAENIPKLREIVRRALGSLPLILSTFEMQRSVGQRSAIVVEVVGPVRS